MASTIEGPQLSTAPPPAPPPEDTPKASWELFFNHRYLREKGFTTDYQRWSIGVYRVPRRQNIHERPSPFMRGKKENDTDDSPSNKL